MYVSISNCLSCGKSLLLIATRPDTISCRCQTNKTALGSCETYFSMLERNPAILYGLHYSNSNSNNCLGFSDVNWGGDLDDRKSTYGYASAIGKTATSWRNKTCVALSSAEAEYVALTIAAQESLWLQQLLSRSEHGRSKSLWSYM